MSTTKKECCDLIQICTFPSPIVDVDAFNMYIFLHIDGTHY